MRERERELVSKVPLHWLQDGGRGGIQISPGPASLAVRAQVPGSSWNWAERHKGASPPSPFSGHPGPPLHLPGAGWTGGVPPSRRPPSWFGMGDGSVMTGVPLSWARKYAHCAITTESLIQVIGCSRQLSRHLAQHVVLCHPAGFARVKRQHQTIGPSCTRLPG